MEFFSHIGINIGANVGLHPDAINSTITCTDNSNASNTIGYTCTAAHWPDES